jgi:hypothetical protein
MSDEPAPKSGDPVELNAKKLTRMVVQHFASFGATALDLRLRYESETGLKTASFFNALRRCRENQWLIGGEKGEPYLLNSNGCWKQALTLLSLENGQERDELECAVELQQEKIERLQARNRSLVGTKRVVAAGEAAGSTISTLLQLMVDSSLPLRRRISAAELLLGFESPTDVHQHTKEFLHSVFSDQDMDIAHRLECAELLRKAEDVQLRPAVARPTAPVVYDTAEEIAARAARRKAHLERQSALDAEMIKQDLERASLSAPRHNGQS